MYTYSATNQWPSHVLAMRAVALWSSIILAVCSILFEISQMDNSMLSLDKTPWVGYAYWLMLLIPLYAVFICAYFAVWFSSIRGKNFPRLQTTWLLVGAAVIVLGRIAWMILHGFVSMYFA